MEAHRGAEAAFEKARDTIRQNTDMTCKLNSLILFLFQWAAGSSLGAISTQ